MKKRNMVTKKPIMKTKTVIFLIVILIIAAILGIYKFKRDFQIEQENPPKLYFYGENGKKIELLPIEYSWEYKGETKTYKDEDFLNRDYSDMETVYLDSALGETGAYLQTEEKYKINSVYREDYQWEGDKYQNFGGGTAGPNYDDNTKIDAGASSSSEGKVLIKYYVQYKKQGYVTYILKADVLDKQYLENKNEFLNTKLEEKYKIEELLKNLKYSQIFSSVNVENNNLIIEYEYFLNENSTLTNNAILFTCIDGIENIVYKAINSKTYYSDKETGTMKKESLDNITINKEEFIQKTGLELSKLQEYVEKEV